MRGKWLYYALAEQDQDKPDRHGGKIQTYGGGIVWRAWLRSRGVIHETLKRSGFDQGASLFVQGVDDRRGEVFIAPIAWK